MSAGWLSGVFGTEKPVVGMVHFPPLPSAPRYDATRGLGLIQDGVARDLEALQSGGIDAVMFCNEDDRPYTLHADQAVVAVMAATIGALRSQIKVPFGVDVLWDARAAVALAAATSAQFVRGIFTGVYDSDMGLWTVSPGEIARYAVSLHCHSRLLYNINAEFASPVGRRSLKEVARSVAFSCEPDALCVSGPMTGDAVDTSDLEAVSAVAQGIPVFINTGTTAGNVLQRLSKADGVIVGTWLKRDGVTWNPVDEKRVGQLMDAVRAVRGG